jgi:hypothetical protein
MVFIPLFSSQIFGILKELACLALSYGIYYDITYVNNIKLLSVPWENGLKRE